MSIQLYWSCTQSEYLFCISIDMSFVDRITIFADDEIVHGMTFWMIVCTRHISSQRLYLVYDAQ